MRQSEFVPGGLAAAATTLMALVLAGCPNGGDPPLPGDPVRGHALFLKNQCLACHKLDQEGAQQQGPQLRGVAARTAALKGGKAQAFAWFKAHLRDPKNNPGPERAKYFLNMPPYDRLSEQELDDLARYLMDL